MLGEILTDRHQLTIADMEAGLEHLTRSDGTLRYVDMLIVVLEPYRKALETARRTLTIASDLGIPRICGVANKVGDGERGEMEAFAERIGLPLLAVIPYDHAARAADRDGAAVIDFAPQADLVVATARMLDAIEAEMSSTPA